MEARPAPPSRQRGGFLASEPLLLVGLVILTLYFARDLLAPMAFALVLNFLLSPAVEVLERWRLSRSVSVVLVILIFFSGLGVTGWVVARQLVHVAELLPDYRDNIQTKLGSLRHQRAPQRDYPTRMRPRSSRRLSRWWNRQFP